MLQDMLAEEVEELRSLGTLILDYPRIQDPKLADPAILASVDAAITNGVVGFSRAMFEACPGVRFIHCFTAGHELIDLDEAERRGVPVSSGLGTNADSVADQALALALGVLRDVPRYDREIRDGRWKASRTQPQFTGKKVGILGMGRIGREIAARAAGFRTQIFYAATAPKPDVAWTFCPSAEALAAAVDVLFVACSGGASTYRLVNRKVLAALGPKGILVNVARGTVVDTDALREALASGLIAGAGLDVIEGEPKIPAWIRDAGNLVISPHVSGGSPESRRGMVDAVKANFAAFYAGRALVNPVVRSARDG